MDSEDSSASWWLHREEPDSPSPPHYHGGGADGVHPVASASFHLRDALSIDQSPEVHHHDAAGGRGVTRTEAAHAKAAAEAMGRLMRKCDKWKRRCEKAMDDNRLLAEEVQRLRSEQARPPTHSDQDSAPVWNANSAASAQQQHQQQQLHDRVKVLEKECEDQRAQLLQLTSAESATMPLATEIEACWPAIESVADDGEQFTCALQSATASATSPEVVTVATRLPDLVRLWSELHENTLADPPASLRPGLDQLSTAIGEERDVLAHLIRVLLSRQAPDTLLHVSAVTDTRLRELEEEHMAEVDELHRVIRDLEKRLAAANSLRRLPWSALSSNGLTDKNFGAAGLDNIPPYTPLADERTGGFISGATSVAAESKPRMPETVEVATQTAVSLEYVLGAAHSTPDGTSRSARRSKELDLIDIMAVEMESLRAELENAKSQLSVLLEQRRRFLGQVDAPLDYSTRVGLARSTGFNVLHPGDTS